jgi:transcriptional regulator with XRE-family HTH domain
MTNTEIAALRKSLNLSMHDFGKLFGVTAPAVIKWEQGFSRPNDMIETSMVHLKNKMDTARATGRENEELERLKVILITGGIAVFLLWLWNQTRD